jgi:ubiquinone/menaquinone biosynthesis C-methylase UbiE
MFRAFGRKRRFLGQVVALSIAIAAVAQQDWSKRDAWQRPAEVMDAMGATTGSVVADVGAGFGYFTFHLAQRVGPQGKVYAVDINKVPLENLRSHAEQEGLKQIETIVGLADDPRLPEGAMDAVLVVNAYHEMRSYDAMLQGMYRALKPGGKLVLMDRPAEPGKPREEYYKQHRMPEQVEREDAVRNGFRFLEKKDDLVDTNKETWYFLVLEKPRPQELVSG